MKTIFASQLEPGTSFPKDQPLFLLKDDAGLVCVTAVGTVTAERSIVDTFVLGFTTVDRARTFVKRVKGFKERVRNILQAPMSYLAQRRDLLVALDVDPDTYQALDGRVVDPGLSFTVLGRASEP